MVHTTTIPPRIKTALRELLVFWKLQDIDNFFQSEGFSPGTIDGEVSGERRTKVEEYYAGINWASPSECARFLRVCESVLDSTGPEVPRRQSLFRLMKADGLIDEKSGRVRLSRPALSVEGLSLSDDAAVHLHLDRIRETAESSPEEAIGASKDLIESACKYVLGELGQQVEAAWDVPQLISRTRDALGLSPNIVAPSDRGYQAVKKTLGGLSSVAIGIVELRNEFGTGHGRPRRISGLRPRHGLLAANAAYAYVLFLLSTLADRHTTGPNE